MSFSRVPSFSRLFFGMPGMCLASWLLLWASAQSMKLHLGTELNTSRSLSCEDTAPTFVGDMAQDLERSYGYDSMFYKGCLQFVHKNADLKLPMIAQIEKFGSVCKQGLFVEGESALGEVDPSVLESECDRVIYNMEVQYKLLGGRSLSTPEGFCAVLIDLVLPIDEEPECMRLVEDVTHAHLEKLGTKHAWPGIIHEPHFDESFMIACLEDKKLGSEGKGREAEFGVGSDECKLALERLMNMPWTKVKGMADFLADVCPLLGKPLPKLTEPPEPTYVSTTRALTAAMFQRAAHLSHFRNKSSSSALSQKKPFSALALHLDESVQGKDSRRRRRRLNHKQATCCDGNARSYELGVSAAAGIAVGTTAVGAEGYGGWHGNDCIYKWGQLQEVCGGVQLGAGLDISVSHGYWNDFDSTKGECRFVGASACFFVCFGGQYVVDLGGTHIGKVMETGGGFGLDVSAGHCNAWKLWEKQETQRDLKDKCPSGGGGGCFPAHAQVRTPDGVKSMQDLRAGDRVLAADSHGNLIFDEVYFFGHAEQKWAPYVKLQLQILSENASQQLGLGSSSLEPLELSPDHFLHVCPLSEPVQQCDFARAQSLYASDVAVGSYVWMCRALGRPCQLAKVISTSFVPGFGLYNPFTLSGNIVVNGVLASAHSSWFMDGLVSPRFRHHLPSFYQAVLMPGRFLYTIAGPRAADALGVNNPQWAQGASQWLRLSTVEFSSSVRVRVLILWLQLQRCLANLRCMQIRFTCNVAAF
ncbi:SHH [Symbiodinium sp. KB8]|nr:SHH [Symbiodinium sp. KB8]